MNVIQGIWRDLIDKRLWPFALALLVLIVAVPVVLTRTGGTPAEEMPESAVIAGAASVNGPRDAVVVEADPGEAPAEGDLRNPFYDPPLPDDAAAGSGGADAAGSPKGTADASAGKPVGQPGTSSAGGGGGTGSAGSDTSSGGSGDSSGGSSKEGSSGGTTKKQSTGSGESGYDVSLRFGTEEDLKAYTAVPRLTPLPSADAPSFVYLGVLSGGKTAVFMIAVDVTAVGDGTCRPSASACETLELKAGETMFLDVPGENGEVTQYQLDVTAIKKVGKGGNTISNEEAGRTTGDANAASAVKAGKKAVRQARKTRARKTLDRYRFVRSRGVVVRRAAPKAKAARGDALQVRATGRVMAGGL